MTCCNRKSLIDKNCEFVIFLSKLSDRDRSRILAVLGREHINTISEIFQNFLGKNLTQNLGCIKRLAKYRQQVREVALRRTPVYRKKEILQSRKGGAILSVLLPLAAGLISSLWK